MTCDCTRTTPELARCACGHKILVHHLTPSKKRAWCTHMDGTNGQCQCKGPR